MKSSIKPIKAKVRAKSNIIRVKKHLTDPINLAMFPMENPNPVLRISRKNILLYANPASAPLLKFWGCTVGSQIPVLFGESISRSVGQHSIEIIELEIDKETYELEIVPIAQTDYINIYGRLVTEHKQIESALRESEKKLRMIYASMTEGLAIHEIVYEDNRAVDYIILDINPAYERITRLTRNQVIGKRPMEVYGTDQPPYLELYAQVAASGQPKYFETYFPPMQKHFSISVFSPEKGKFASIFVDITERKKKEAELYKLSRTRKALSKSSQAMMHATNQTEYLDNVCRIVVEDCGYAMVWIGFAEADEAKTVRPVAFAGFDAGYLETLQISWADTERGYGPTGTAIRTGQPSMCRNMLTDPKFSPWRAEALKRGYASSLVLPLKKAGGTFGTITIYSKEPDAFNENDIQLLTELAGDLVFGIETIILRDEHAKADEVLMRDKETIEQRAREKSEELIKTQLELAQAKRLSDIGFLAATVAHELRNPLAAITMAAANIKRKAPIADLGNNLNTIANKIAESNQIINNLLFYSKLRPPKLERIKLSTLLEECIENIEKQNQNELKIKVQTASIQDMLINADLLQLKEVFLNLLNNAVDAVDEKSGKIELWAETTPAEIHVYVKDNGTGITTEDLERIFDPFFTTKAKGTGLGLTICNQIIKLHGGHITIESKVQYGTTLLISLPRQVELGQ